MQNQDEKRNIELDSRKKSGWVKIVAVVVIVAAVLGGWKWYKGRNAAPQQTMQQQAAPSVIVKAVEKADLSSQPAEYVGRIEAIQTVQVKPQISGEIARVCFKEGSVVKAGQLLFQIDPSIYQATVQLRQAELEKAQASLEDAKKYYARVKAADARAVSAAEKDTAETNVMQGEAAVAQCRANLRLAQINLNWCSIKSPITGKIGIANFTKGNYVTPQSGALAQIVQINPVRVAYSLPDRDYLDQIAQFNKKTNVYKTRLMLSNGQEITASGERDFEDNTIDQSTGTVMVRLRYGNDGGRLIPGELVRVFTRSVNSKFGLVIPQASVLADSKGDYVYLVQGDDTVRQVRVKLGQEFGSLREVTEGLKEGERVVVEGLQQVGPGAKVTINKNAAENSAETNSVLEQTSGVQLESGTSKEGN